MQGNSTADYPCRNLEALLNCEFFRVAHGKVGSYSLQKLLGLVALFLSWFMTGKIKDTQSMATAMAIFFFSIFLLVLPSASSDDKITKWVGVGAIVVTIVLALVPFGLLSGVLAIGASDLSVQLTSGYIFQPGMIFYLKPFWIIVGILLFLIQIALWILWGVARSSRKDRWTKKDVSK